APRVAAQGTTPDSTQTWITVPPQDSTRFSAPDTSAAVTAKAHFFPLRKELAKDRPQLPPPDGVGLLANWIDPDTKFTSGTVALDNPNVPVEAATNCSMDITFSTIGPRADLWVLPILNLFVVIGQTDSDNRLVMRDVPVGFLPPTAANPAGQVVRGDATVDFTLKGPYYTLGGVLSAGYKNFLSTVDFSASQTDFGKKGAVQGDQSWTYSVYPRFGYVVLLSQVWVGARYLDVTSHYTGGAVLTGGQVLHFDVHMKTASWNAAAGMRTVLDDHWETLLELGFGQRHLMTASVGYRW